MVRSVVLDEPLQKYSSDHVSQRKQEEVGILIGRIASTGKEFGLQLVPCPSQAGETPITRSKAASSASTSSKGGSKANKSQGTGGGSLTFDQDWIVEHAAQVSRLLPGGLDVIALYVICPEATFSSSSNKIIALLKDAGREIASTGNSSDLFILHIDSITGKIAAKELSSTSLKPCDLKVSTMSILKSMVEIKCQYPVTWQLEIAAAENQSKLDSVLRKAAQWEKEHVLKPSIGFSNSSDQILGDEQLADILSSEEESDGLTMSLASPVASSSLALKFVGKTDGSITRGKGLFKSSGKLTIDGLLDCRAFVHKREPAKAAVEAIKSDIIRTLDVRRAVLLDAAEIAAESIDEQNTNKENSAAAKITVHPLLSTVENSKNASFKLPQRAFVRWKQGGGCYCDYFTESESVDGAIERLQELVGSELLDAARIECLETVSGGGSFSESRGASSGNGKNRRETVLNESLYCNMVAVSVAAVAAFLGYMSLSQ